MSFVSICDTYNTFSYPAEKCHLLITSADLQNTFTIEENTMNPDQTAIWEQSGPEVIKLFVLNSTEHEIQTAHVAGSSLTGLTALWSLSKTHLS